MEHDKVVLLMHAGPCVRADEFAPRLAEIARQMPSLAYGRIDVQSNAKMVVSAAAGVAPGAPALKAFFRNAPPGMRVLEYRGPPTLEAVLDWVRAIDKWDGSENLPDGFEIGRPPKPDEQATGSSRNERAVPKDEM